MKFCFFFIRPILFIHWCRCFIRHLELGNQAPTLNRKLCSLPVCFLRQSCGGRENAHFAVVLSNIISIQKNCDRCMFQEIIDKILRHHRRDEKVVASCEIKNVTFYYPASLRRVQITPKTSTIILRYLYSPRKKNGSLDRRLYSRGLVRRVFSQHASNRLNRS